MSTSALRLVASPQTYRRRRAKLATALQRPVAIFAGHALARTYATNTLPFRPESTYLYFGGPALEHAALWIEPGSDGNAGTTLFRVPAGEDDALWLGPTPTDADLAAASGLDRSRILDAERLGEAARGRSAAAFVPPHPDTIAGVERLGLDAPTTDEKLAVIHLRLIKDDEELAAMRAAAEAEVAAHRAAFAACQPGRTDSEVEAALVAEYVARGCSPSFTPIVTVRGEVFHGASARRPLLAGALLLIDAGAEEPGGYASDITRTIPVAGRWTPLQRQLYETVLRAQRTAIGMCRPGVRYRDIHDAAGAAICAGLVEAELLTGEPAALAERGAYTLFFPHGVGHLLGLGVHDLEEFGDLAGYAPGRTRRARFGDSYLRLDRDLEPGMVVTIEPGIYFVPDIWRRDALVGPLADVVNRSAVDAVLGENFGGIRIEENVVVRETAAGGPEVLTAALPNDADEVAALVGAAR